MPSDRINKIVNELLDSKNYPVFENYVDTSAGVPKKLKHKSKEPKTSAYNYPPELKKLIEHPQTRWALDCGSGSKSIPHENVVQFEIAPFPEVDVVGHAEKLPFKSDSFDLVISLSVLEHTKDPRLAMTEMQRVLKPGGLLWIDTAFMQPYHGFPSHYFNMTQEGLTSLLDPTMEIIRDTVPEYGTPIHSLAWIITNYTLSLPEAIKEQMLDLPLRYFLKDIEMLKREAFNTHLPEKKRKDLAATVSVLAKKRDNA